MKELARLTESQIHERMNTFHKLNNSSTVCVSKFHFLKINPFGETVVSCCKATMNQIDIKDLGKVNNLDELINHTEIKQDRQLMLDNKRPKSCQFCWKVETDPSIISQRHQDSVVKYTTKFDKVMQVDQKIEYLEVSLNNTCNLRCIYCSSDHSSRIEMDLKANGPIRHGSDYVESPIRLLSKEERNSNQERLTQLIIDTLPQLRTLMLTGGEPLLDKDIWRILDQLEKPRATSLFTSIVTNLNHSKALINKLLVKMQSIISVNKEIMIVVSCDTIGEEAEIIRDGLDYALFIDNLEYVLEKTQDLGVTVLINSTISSLSIKSKIKWIESLIPLFEKYPLLSMNLSTAVGRSYLTPCALPRSVTKRFINDMEILLDHPILTTRISNWEAVSNRLHQDIDTADPSRLLIQLRQHIIDRSERYGKDVTVFKKWIDNMILGF